MAATVRSLPARNVSRSGRTPVGSTLYVISTHKVRDRTGGPPYGWLPYGTQHAWRPGTHRTLCGEWTAEWTVFWELRFAATSAACSACVEASLPEASRRRLDRVRAVSA